MSDERSVAYPHLTPERRAALFVLNDLFDQLDQMEASHVEDTGDWSRGHSEAIDEVRAWAQRR